jgi:hypothetical protein
MCGSKKEKNAKADSLNQSGLIVMARPTGYERVKQLAIAAAATEPLDLRKACGPAKRDCPTQMLWC